MRVIAFHTCAQLMCPRYCNVDYIFGMVFPFIPPEVRKVISYDIMCQWLRNLLDRIARLPGHIRVELPQGDNLRYAIPKYHFNGHKEQDHNKFSLNFMKGVGRTDGEEVERGWSRFDGVASSTREMGPGSREETLEDHFSWNNEQKYITIGECLRPLCSVSRS